MKLGIIGCGNMGLTYAKSFLRYELIKKEDLYLYEKNEITDELSEIGINGSLKDGSLQKLDIIILAIKPQDVQALSIELNSLMSKNIVVVSIMAGITISKLMDTLNHRFIIRAMPNTPSQIGQGMTAFTASDDITIGQLRKIEKLFNTTGRSVFVDQESHLDPVTALSGSGPAYVFYFLKSMIEAGVKLGLSESDSALLSRQTFQGAVQLYNQSTKSLDDLISMVRSKGGTTDAALNFFDQNKLDEIIQGGIEKANDRSIELCI